MIIILVLLYIHHTIMSVLKVIVKFIFGWFYSGKVHQFRWIHT